MPSFDKRISHMSGSPRGSTKVVCRVLWYAKYTLPLRCKLYRDVSYFDNIVIVIVSLAVGGGLTRKEDEGSSNCCDCCGGGCQKAKTAQGQKLFPMFLVFIFLFPRVAPINFKTSSIVRCFRRCRSGRVGRGKKIDDEQED